MADEFGEMLREISDEARAVEMKFGSSTPRYLLLGKQTYVRLARAFMHSELKQFTAAQLPIDAVTLNEVLGLTIVVDPEASERMRVVTGAGAEAYG